MGILQWPRARQLAVGIWALFWGLYVVLQGIPFDRATQLLMTISLALVFMVGTDRGSVQVLLDWLPFFAFFYAYDFTRGAADTLGMPVQVASVYHLELSWFGIGGVTPTIWLQRLLYDPTYIHGWEGLVAIIYCTHFVVPWTIAAVLYVRNRDRWLAFARRIMTVSFAALITYVLVPAAPPWYAAKVGLSDPVVRISVRGWNVLGLPIANQLISLGQGVVNAVAALPSLHAGTTVTIALFFWPKAWWWLRIIFVAYILSMLFTLVYGGEHYVFDVVLGWIYAVIVEILVRVWERRRSAEIPISS